MCSQCMAAAVTAAAGATGFRAWVAGHRPGWLTDGRLRALSAGAIAVGATAAATLSG